MSKKEHYIVNCYTCQHNGQETCKGCNTLLNGEDETYQNWELREDLQYRDNKIEDLQSQLAEKERQVKVYAHEIAFLDNKLAKKEKEIERLKNVVEDCCKKYKGNPTTLYATWCNMKSRCYCKTNTCYKHYGGRGIKICDEWINNFDNFKNWALSNGFKSGLTIDRIDVNGDYCPENCRWTTRKLQSDNKRDTKHFLYNGNMFTLNELSDKYNVKYNILYDRMFRLGWDIDKAIKTQVRKLNRNQ